MTRIFFYSLSSVLKKKNYMKRKDKNGKNLIFTMLFDQYILNVSAEKW